MNLKTTVALLTLLQSCRLASAWSYNNFVTGTSQQRQSCTYYEAFGCILDVMEKLCQEEDNSPLSRHSMHPDNGESAWLCCCPAPYTNCDPDTEMHQACLASMIKHVEPVLPLDHTQNALNAVR